MSTMTVDGAIPPRKRRRRPSRSAVRRRPPPPSHAAKRRRLAAAGAAGDAPTLAIPSPRELLDGYARQTETTDDVPLLRTLVRTALTCARVAETWAQRAVRAHARRPPVRGRPRHEWLTRGLGFLLARDVPWQLALTESALQLWAPWQDGPAQQQAQGAAASEHWFVPLDALPTRGVGLVHAVVRRADRLFAHCGASGTQWRACRHDGTLPDLADARATAATHFVRAVLRALETAGAPRFALLVDLQRALADLLPSQPPASAARRWMYRALDAVARGEWPPRCGETRACAACYKGSVPRATRSEYAESVARFQEARATAERAQVDAMLRDMEARGGGQSLLTLGPPVGRDLGSDDSR